MCVFTEVAGGIGQSQVAQLGKAATRRNWRLVVGLRSRAPVRFAAINRRIGNPDDFKSDALILNRCRGVLFYYIFPGHSPTIISGQLRPRP